MPHTNSCSECRNGFLLQDSLQFDLDREDEQQPCPNYLIHAAPDLLEALKELLGQVDNLPHLGPIEGPVSYSVNKARAAIAKAEGR